MLAGAVNLQIEQLELQWSLLVRCVTKSEPKRGQTDRIPDKRDTRRCPRAGRKASSIATCPGPREKRGTRGTRRGFQIVQDLHSAGLEDAIAPKGKFGCPPGIRTPIACSRGRCPSR